MSYKVSVEDENGVRYIVGFKFETKKAAQEYISEQKKKYGDYAHKNMKVIEVKR